MSSALKSDRKAYIVTGPTSGYGRATALKLAQYGTIILVGRDSKKLDAMKRLIERKGGAAVSVVCNLSDLVSVRRAAEEIISLELPIVALLNNAGIGSPTSKKSAQGLDLVFATNHLGPFVLTEALIPHLPDGGNILFVASAVEDPERKAAKMAGFRGGRYISAEASSRGEWLPGGAKNAGYDAYATSKQCNLATALEFAHETPRLHFNAVEPGFSPSTGLGRDANIFLYLLGKYVLSMLTPLIQGSSNPRKASSVITRLLLNESGQTGVYYDEKGLPMSGSEQVRDRKFTSRVVAETRALLSKILNVSSK